jgi:secreted PhoX family phosphatase
VAIFDNKAFALPKLGHFAKENTLVMRGTGDDTVIISLEDGPSGPDSQLYLYIGEKDDDAPSGSLARNGLDNGELYVFAGDDSAKNNELGFQSGTTTGRWVLIPGAEAMTEAQLETAADAAGAFGFVRIEDGAFNKKSHRDFYFVTTGGNKAAGNELGRLYHLRFNREDPTGPASLKIVYNADAVVAAGGDTALSPDNVDTSRGYLMINEDGTSQSRPVMQAKGRDGGIWRFELDGRRVDFDEREFVAELDPPGRDGVPVPVSGTWETSGIIDASRFFGRDTWLFDVQAHSPTTAPGVNTVEDGQLLIMVPADDGDEDD